MNDTSVGLHRYLLVGIFRVFGDPLEDWDGDLVKIGEEAVVTIY